MKLGLLGAKGRMGTLIAAETDITVAIARGDDAEKAFTRCDVVIDFSSASAVARHAALAAKHKKSYLCGVTGLGIDAQEALARASEDTAVLYAPNTSLGITLLLSLVSQAAKALPDFAIDILDCHHIHKKDAPSGTSLALECAAGRSVRHESIREGEIVGEHTVTFSGEGESIVLAHCATDRAIFARGAIKAAAWLSGKKPGMYAMKDVLT